jgi:hypothetical protein
MMGGRKMTVLKTWSCCKAVILSGDSPIRYTIRVPELLDHHEQEDSSRMDDRSTALSLMESMADRDEEYYR